MAKHFYAHENSETNSTRRFNERFRLLEELKTNAQKVNEQKLQEEEEIEEMLKEFSDYWNILLVEYCLYTSEV